MLRLFGEKLRVILRTQHVLTGKQADPCLGPPGRPQGTALGSTVRSPVSLPEFISLSITFNLD